MFKHKNAVGIRLKELRNDLGITGAEIASRIGCTQSLVSKIETGKIKPSKELIQKFCAVLNISKEKREELLEFTEAFLISFDRWGREDSSITELQEAVSSREHKAKYIRSFYWNVLNGLLQTRDYARAIFTIGDCELSQDEIEAALHTRIKRQNIALKGDKVIQLVHSEAVLGNLILNAERMRVQLQKLIDVIHNSTTIELRILPLNTQVSILPMSNFVLYDESVVEMETQNFCFHFWEKQDIDVYKRLFDKILVETVGGKRAEMIIKRYLRNMTINSKGKHS